MKGYIIENYGINPAALNAFLEGDIENAIIASTPGGIVQQEKQSQKDFVNSELLPIECNYCTPKDLESMGIVFGEKEDELFINCELPKGWKRIPTDHDMWSNLVDENGCERAAIFYKGAFYDRNAHISIHARYHYEIISEDGGEDWTRKGKMIVGVVKDRKFKDKVIYRTDPIIYENPSYDDIPVQACRRFLQREHPQWDNNLAYWGSYHDGIYLTEIEERSIKVHIDKAKEYLNESPEHRIVDYVRDVFLNDFRLLRYGLHRRPISADDNSDGWVIMPIGEAIIKIFIAAFFKSESEEINQV